MRAQHADGWTRRRFLGGLTVAGTAGLLGLHAGPVAAEPPPEITKVRLVHSPAICLAPQYLAEELLRLEGFSEVEYVEVGSATGPDTVAAGRADATMWDAPSHLPALDAGKPVVGPVLEPVGMGSEDLLDTVHGEMWRRRFHRRHERPFEGCRLPGALGVRARWRAPPHRQGEWGGHGTDQGRALGHARELLLQIVALAQEMALAVLDGAGALGVAAIPSDPQAARPPRLAEDALGHAGPASLAEQTPAEPGGGKQPGIAMVPRRPPAGLVGMLDRRAAGLRQQLIRNAGTPPRHPLEALYEAARAQPRLFADAPQREAVAISGFPERLLGRTAGARGWKGRRHGGPSCFGSRERTRSACTGRLSKPKRPSVPFSSQEAVPAGPRWPPAAAPSTTRSAGLASKAWRPAPRCPGRAPCRLEAWAAGVWALTGRLAAGVAEPKKPSVT